MGNKPHPHRDLIIAWANGAEIQQLLEDGTWLTDRTPEWFTGVRYRIKSRVPESVNLEQLKDLFETYKDTLDRHMRDEWYTTEHDMAKDVFDNFIIWLEGA